MSSTFDTFKDELFEKDLLSEEEERDLVRRNAEGDNKAREALITAYSRLALSTALKYYQKIVGVELEDLTSEAIEGLIHGIDKFDPEKMHNGKPIRVSTYVAWWIRCYVSNFISKSSGVHIPIGKAKEMYSWNPKRERPQIVRFEFESTLDTLSHDPTKDYEYLTDIDTKIDCSRIREQVDEIVSEMSSAEQTVLNRHFFSNNPESFVNIAKDIPSPTMEEGDEYRSISNKTVGNMEKRAVGKIVKTVRRKLRVTEK